jgi:hypothetical protein
MLAASRRAPIRASRADPGVARRFGRRAPIAASRRDIAL